MGTDPKTCSLASRVSPRRVGRYDGGVYGVDWVQGLLATAVMALAALVQGAVGFGSALVAAPLLALLDPRFVPVPIILANFVLTLLVVAREHQALNLRAVGWAVTGRLPGTWLGLLALTGFSATQLPRFFAALVLGAVLLLLLGRAPPRNPLSLFVAGTTAGLMGTVTSIGGPPIALMFHDVRGAELRGTLGGYFVASTLMSIAGFGLTGLLGIEELIRAALLLPGLLVGFYASNRGRRFLDQGYTRPAVLTLATLAAVGVLVRG